MGRLEDGNYALQLARQAEKKGDYLGARVNFLKCVESYKQAAAETELENATKEYEEFVKRDPIFQKLFLMLNSGIKENPGILQSDITGKFESLNWGQLYNYDRPIAQDDVRYVLYFAEKFGYITRNKKGRSYELFSNGDISNFNTATRNITNEPNSTNFSKETTGSVLDNLTAEDIQEIRQVVRETAEKSVAEKYNQVRQEKENKVKAENKRLTIISLIVIGIVIIICLKICSL